MINPYNQKIKSVNIIWTCFFVFISFFLNYTCSKIVSFCVIPSDKDLYLESENDTFIIYNREGGRERKIERENSTLKQQHAAGQNTTSSEQACPIEDQLLHFEEREKEK